MHFTKMHGCGNDFVLFDELKYGKVSLNEQNAIKICDRHFGVGADQILVLTKPKNFPDCDTRMDIWNADGSLGEMCGNGIRAVALYLAKHHKAQSSYRIETPSGVKIVQLENSEVTVDMSKPALGRGFGTTGDFFVTLESGKGIQGYEVDTGVPHLVIFVTDLNSVNLAAVGPEIENHRLFPRKTNVNFAQVVSDRLIISKVWERGAGITLACGTGATAVGVAAIQLGKVKSPVKVKVPGGELEISWGRKDADSAFMKGPAVEVFQGETAALF